jgi:hypothetical protein
MRFRLVTAQSTYRADKVQVLERYGFAFVPCLDRYGAVDQVWVKKDTTVPVYLELESLEDLLIFLEIIGDAVIVDLVNGEPEIMIYDGPLE